MLESMTYKGDKLPVREDEPDRLVVDSHYTKISSLCARMSRISSTPSAHAVFTAPTRMYSSFDTGMTPLEVHLKGSCAS